MLCLHRKGNENTLGDLRKEITKLQDQLTFKDQEIKNLMEELEEEKARQAYVCVCMCVFAVAL